MQRKLGTKVALLAIVLLLLLGYSFSYLIVSRRGIEEAAEYGLEGIVYVRLDRILDPENNSADVRNADWQSHVARSRLYYPAWLIDHLVFGTPEPILPPLVNLEQAQHSSRETPFVDNETTRQD